MGNIYNGTGWNRTAVGECENGTIYRGTGWSRNPIGEYDNGTIYRGTGWSRTPIGEYDNGMIYRDTGWSRTAVGECNDIFSAAALLLFSFDEATTVGGNTNIGNDSSFFDVLLAFIMMIGATLFKVAKFLYIYALAPLSCMVPCYVFAMMLFCFIGFPYSIMMGIFTTFGISFLPYFFILLYRKIKHQISLEEMFVYYAIWWLKGPYIYYEMIKGKTIKSVEIKHIFIKWFIGYLTFGAPTIIAIEIACKILREIYKRKKFEKTTQQKE